MKVANLDFEARIPVPFSIFPRTYKEAAEAKTTTETHEELEIKLPATPEKAGREGQYSSISAPAQLPPRREQRYSEEEVRITREEERYRRPGVKHEYEKPRPANVNVFQDSRTYNQAPAFRPQYASSTRSESSVEIDRRHKPTYSTIDRIEREYRSRVQPSVYKDEVRVTDTTLDAPARRQNFDNRVAATSTTVDTPIHRPKFAENVSVTEETLDAPKATSSFHKDVKITEDTVGYPRHSSAYQKSRMGYYDEEGHYHSFRHGLHKMADRLLHPDERVEVRETYSSSGPAPRSGGSPSIPNTVTIPCHHIRMGDILMLQGRPCQVIRISTSAATGQHRYLGVDLFSKQLHEESSFVSNPAPSVVVQTMLGPVFKQYRVLDIQQGTVTAMTESGDVKTGLPVVDQSGLFPRLTSAFNEGHGSVRVLVLSDNGNELVVDVKVVHGSRL
ncbi:hypothetical protein F4861DRAFT_549897 [Xylaria intraflava]|nr:hypothetical protein F4861DRAFT_549897 [Xylaria intraflava]